MSSGETKARFHVLTCDCQGTSPLDQTSIAACAGTAVGAGATQLCRKQIDRFKQALADESHILVGCTQEAPLFLEVADEAEFGGELRFVNIREKAGWSNENRDAGAKMGALIAEAALTIAGPHVVTMSSSGIVLVIGRDEVALEAAQRLAARMDVTLLLTGEAELLPPRIAEVPIFHGKVLHARGHLGAFEVEIGDHAAAVPAARGRLVFEPAAAARSISRCDIVLDLRGEPPLVRAPDKRDGYFNPDPRDPAAVARTLFDIADMVGEFEKPRYIEYEHAICAHSRNGIVACSRCLDHCPTGAITPHGDGVEVDPFVCAGCGNCATVCPTGAVRYRMPRSESLLTRMRTLLRAYDTGRGRRAVLLFHDGKYGEEMISAIARNYDGLPANVIPVAVNAVSQCGLEVLTAARVYGAAASVLLVPPAQDDDLAGLTEAAALNNLIMDALGYDDGKAEVSSERDPEALAAQLRATAAVNSDGPRIEAFTPAGGKRDLLSLALFALHNAAPAPVDEVALPEGAPFGTLDVDVDNCTLCLACAGVCPTHALRDTADYPRLTFLETACVQCGLCAKTCPEKVITLHPRLEFTNTARNPRIIKEEEPFACVRCNKPIGTKSMIQKVQQRMSTHSMFASASALRRIQMCADCRVIDLAESGDDPFAGAPRPVPRTTEDDLRERELGIRNDDDKKT